MVLISCFKVGPQYSKNEPPSYRKGPRGPVTRTAALGAICLARCRKPPPPIPADFKSTIIIHCLRGCFLKRSRPWSSSGTHTGENASVEMICGKEQRLRYWSSTISTVGFALLEML